MRKTDILPVPENLPPLTAISRNLVRFCRHTPEESLDASFAANFSFRDSGSRFSILKNPKTAPGPDDCFGLFARDDRTIFRKLLGMKVTYDGLTPEQQAQITDYNSMNYYRSHVAEIFCHNGFQPMPPTEGECVMWFPAPDVLAIRYRLLNKADSDVAVHLSWFSEGDPGQGFKASATKNGFLFQNNQTVIRHAYISRAELLAQDDDIRFTADGTELKSSAVSRIIPARGMIECRFAVRFAFNDESLPEWPLEVWSDTGLVRVIRETETAYEQLPELETEFSRYRDLVLKAAGTLRNLRYCDYDASRNRRMTIHVGKSGTAATWFWDTGASLPGLGYLQDRDSAPGALRILLDGIKEDGTPPVTYECQKYLYSYQIPLLTWGVGHYLELCPDRQLLAEAYEPLSRYVRHWLDRYTIAHGLVTYPSGNTSLDDALRWNEGSPLTPREGQPWFEQRWGRMAQALFASPDINAFLYLELRTLAVMASALGKEEDAKGFRERAKQLAKAINDFLVEPETLTYQDRHIETGVFTGMINMGSFIPVYAGIAPPEVAESLCRDYLLSPDHFLTHFPFPVVDRAHPTFRPGGFLHEPSGYPGSLVQHSYWRGRTWIHGNAWMLGALWQCGFHREADEIAARVLDGVNRSEGINECYDSLTGFGNGHPEFMWSSAAVLALAYGFYRKNSVAHL